MLRLPLPSPPTRRGPRSFAAPALLLAALLALLPAAARGAEPARPAAYTALAGAEAEALLQSISRRMGAVRSFEAPFTQEHHLALYLDVLKARGVSRFQAPDRFRWELSEPYRSILVYNRDRVAKFEERDGRLRYVESGAYDAIRSLMGQMTAWMRGDFRETRDGFSLRVLEGPDYQIELTPRSKAMTPYIQRIEVYLRREPVQAARIVIREPEKDYIEIRFGAVRENLSLDPRLFDPKGPLVP